LLKVTCEVRLVVEQTCDFHTKEITINPRDKQYHDIHRQRTWSKIGKLKLQQHKNPNYSLKEN